MKQIVSVNTIIVGGILLITFALLALADIMNLKVVVTDFFKTGLSVLLCHPDIFDLFCYVQAAAPRSEMVRAGFWCAGSFLHIQRTVYKRCIPSDYTFDNVYSILVFN